MGHTPSDMAIGTSIALIAVGAILKYAVDWSISGIDLQTVGVILMIVGVVGLALGLVMMLMGRGNGRGPGPPDRRTERIERYDRY